MNTIRSIKSIQKLNDIQTIKITQELLDTSDNTRMTT